MRTLRSLVLWLSGFATATGLMVTDEIINLAQLCPSCRYPYPLLGPVSIWTAWEIAFTIILAGVLVGLVTIREK